MDHVMVEYPFLKRVGQFTMLVTQEADLLGIYCRKKVQQILWLKLPIVLHIL